MVLLVAPVATSWAAIGDVEEGLLEKVERLAREASGGDLSQTGTLTVYGAGGAVAEEITGQQFLQEVREALSGEPVGPGADHLIGSYTGYAGVNSAELSRALGWRSCAAFYITTISFGRSALVHADPLLQVGSILSPPRPVQGQPVCGYNTILWQDVTFDARRGFGCQGGQFTLDGTTTPPTLGVPGGSKCGWEFACGTGEGVLLRSSFFGIHLDRFLGGTAHGWYGPYASVVTPPAGQPPCLDP